MQQLLVMMQKISAEPNNNARTESEATSDVKPDAEPEAEPDANSSEINTDSYRPSEAPEPPLSEVRKQRKPGIASPENTVIPSAELPAADQIDMQSASSAEVSQSGQLPSDLTQTHDSGPANIDVPSGDGPESNSDEGSSGKEVLEMDASESALVVQPQQPKVDEKPIATVSTSSASIQSVDTDPDEQVEGLSVNATGKPPGGNAGLLKRWLSKAVSWLKQLVGF